MPLYCGIDLHSTSSYLVILDAKDQVVTAFGPRVAGRTGSSIAEADPALLSSVPCQKSTHRR